MGRQYAAVAALFVALSVAMTWPLAANLDRAVSDPGDPWIVAWILDWDWWATVHQPLSLFHANAFHPAKYSLAFTENLYGVALLLFPLRAFGAGPLVAYNVAILLGFAFCGFGAYLLGQRLTGSVVAGLAAGIFYAFVPFRFVHLSHLQHVWGGWLPLLLFALLLYAERPDRRRAVLFGFVFLMNGLTNIHYLFFGTFASAVTAGLLLPRKAWKELLLALAAALLLLAPFLYPYYAASKLYGMERTWEDVQSFSALPSDWITHSQEPERRVFPGVLAYAVAAAGIVLARRQKAAVVLGLCWIAIGFLGSLGLNFEFHRFLFGAVPGFRSLRVPARWAVIAYVGLAILIALLTAVLARRSRWLALLVPGAFVLGLWVAPIRWYLSDPNPPAVYRWLDEQKDVRAIVELPVEAAEHEVMLNATVHHKPFMNGISGFAPPVRRDLASLFYQTPIPDGLVELFHQSGTDLIIVRGDLVGGREAAINEWLDRELARGRLSYVASFDSRIRGDHVYRVRGGKGFFAPADPRRPESRRATATPCRDTIGALNFPPAGFVFDAGGIFAGWTISPHGIREVNLYFNNRRVRHRATLSAAELSEHCTGNQQVTRRNFLVLLPVKPKNIREATDIQVEIIDGRGVRKVLDNRWIEWK